MKKNSKRARKSRLKINGLATQSPSRLNPEQNSITKTFFSNEKNIFKFTQRNCAGMKPSLILKLLNMVIISRPVLRDFIARYPLSANALNEWYTRTAKGDWGHFADVKQTWNSCDALGNDRYVFDIGGNNYRLIAMIHFKKRTLYIRRVLTHKEYDMLNKRGDLKTL